MSRWISMAVVAYALACGPAVATPEDGTGSETGVVSTGLATLTGASTASTSGTGATTVATTSTTDASVSDSGCLDGCGMCPWEPCPRGQTCDEDTLTCVPIPGVLPACDDPTWVVEPVEIPIGLTAIDLTFVDVDGAGGRELVLVDDNGMIEIRTPTLDPWATSALLEPVTRIFAADVDGDVFGDLIGLTVPSAWIHALSGDGAGTFGVNVQFNPGGVGRIAVGDWNQDGLDDVAFAQVQDGVATIVSALRDQDGFAVVATIPIDAPADALVAIPSDDGTGRDLVVGVAQSIFRFTGAGDGTFLPSGATGASIVTDLAGFRGYDGTGTQIASLGSNEPGVALELFDAELGYVGGWPLPQIGSPRRIAAFGDPWSFDKDLLVVLGNAPTILVVVEPWSDVPCFISVDAGPGVSVALGYTYPLVATEDAALVRLDFP